MGIILLAVYLILVGLTSLLSLAIPAWVIGLLALIAGILLLVERWHPINL